LIEGQALTVSLDEEGPFEGQTRKRPYLVVDGRLIRLSAAQFETIVPGRRYAIELASPSVIHRLFRGNRLELRQLEPRPKLTPGIDSDGYHSLFVLFAVLAEGALGNRSRQVKSIIDTAEPSSDGVAMVIDRVRSSSGRFVSAARFNSLADEMQAHFERLATSAEAQDSGSS
jgi:hypothetical protein